MRRVRKSEIKGRKLLKQAILLRRSGKTYEEIAAQCSVTVEEVKDMLEGIGWYLPENDPPDSQPAKVPAVFRIKSKKNVRNHLGVAKPGWPPSRPFLGTA